MSQAGVNDYDEKALQRLASTLVEKIDVGARKTESFSSACIYRVPEDLRKLNERAYTPRLIAIGPLHRNDKHLQTSMQHVKMSYVNNLLCRLTAGMEGLELAEKKSALLQECLAEMKKLIADVNNCYLAEVTLDEEMMLVDGCFILEFFYRARSLKLERAEEEEKRKPISGGDNGKSKGRKSDPIFGNSLTAYTVVYDLLLLENQIPFLVLEKLFQITVAQIPNRLDKHWLLTDYVWGCYGNMIMSPDEGSSTNSSHANTWCSPRDCVLRVFCNKLKNSTTAAAAEEVQSGNSDRRNAKYYHILHKIHDAYLPRDQTKRKKHRPSKLEVLMPSASDLVYAGVKFEPGTANNLFKVQFTEPEGLFWWYHRARFEIPRLKIYDRTESLLRNLIAFEQCCPGISQHVSSYASVMDMLVNSDKDIQVLEKAGVVSNYLGASEDATHQFNKICKEMVDGEVFFAETCMKATKYSNRFWPKNMAHVRRTYFDSPWTFIAFCVGFIAFIMSFLQFVRDFLKKSG